MKKIFLTFLFCTFSLIPMQQKNEIRSQFHDHSPIGQLISTTTEDVLFKQNTRKILHEIDGVEALFRTTQSSLPIISLSPYDHLPHHLLDSYKKGYELTPQEKQMVITYLYRQIEANRYTYELGHSIHAPLVLRIFGILTLPLRWGVYKCTHKYSGWEKDLNDLTIEETTYTFP